MDDLLILIPARGGSKRLPGKNLKQLNGCSLLAWTEAVIRDAGLGAPRLLSTDDDAIAAEGESLGWQVPFRRPAELAGDDAASLDVVLHALDWHRASLGRDPEALLLLQPTSPFRGGACLHDAVARLSAEPRTDAVIGMLSWNRAPDRIYSTKSNGGLQPLGNASQPCLYHTPNGALYLARTAAIREENTLFPRRIHPLAMDSLHSIDIDTIDDWNFAQAIAATGLVIIPDAANLASAGLNP